MVIHYLPFTIWQLGGQMLRRAQHDKGRKREQISKWKKQKCRLKCKNRIDDVGWVFMIAGYEPMQRL
ncbi:MAG: hypothetical protein ACYTEQ_27025, partial [Planctomycetota bacterium]